MKATVRYENRNEDHNKYYEITVEDVGLSYRVTANYGKIGAIYGAEKVYYEGSDASEAKRICEDIKSKRAAHGYTKIN
jgi:predicted DNA-binding WGR domain protein